MLLWILGYMYLFQGEEVYVSFLIRVFCLFWSQCPRLGLLDHMATIFLVSFWQHWVLAIACKHSLAVVKGDDLLIVVCGFLTAVASLVAEYGLQWLWHMGSRAWTYLPHGMWNLPGPEIKPMSPALAGRLLTTGVPGKSYF